MKDRDFQALGDADVRVGGLSLWTRARQYPAASDRWDANWLETTAYCRYPGSRITVTGPYLRTDEIHKFAEECAALHETLTGTACLDCMEPYLQVRLTGNARGQIGLRITLTPDPLTQRHQFEDQMDQSYLPDIVTRCRQILRRFPILGLET